MRGLKIILAAALATGLAAAATAQEKKDVVVLRTKGQDKGVVLKEDWKSVDIDKDGDGKADASYETDKVDHIEYGARPRYMLDAKLLKSTNPKEYIATLSRAYDDDRTPKFILQHAYHDIAAAYVDLAKTDPAMMQEALNAYEKLFTRIPDTRYAISGRMELGELLLGEGKTDQALRQFQALADGTYGPKAAQWGKLMVARAQLAAGRYEEAEKVLTQLAGAGKMEDVELAHELRLLRSRSLVGQKKLDEAWAGVEGVLKEKPSPKTLGVAYGVLGDLFAAKGDFRAALTAYLKVPLMYPDAGAAEKAQALKQAAVMLEKLGRAREIDSVKKLAGD